MIELIETGLEVAFRQTVGQLYSVLLDNIATAKTAAQKTTAVEKYKTGLGLAIEVYRLANKHDSF